MQYFGGKQRIADDIVPIIQLFRGDRPYFEPFVGGANIIHKVTGGVRIASDIMPDLIALYKELQNGWQPPMNLTVEQYQQLKADPEPTALKAFAGFGCSFAGKYFGGYAGNNTERSYATNAANSLKKKTKGLDGVDFYCGSYDSFTPQGCLIYCDPPYKGTTAYKGAGKFDSERFWDICRKWATNNIVLISEYDAPSDFILVWEKAVKTDIRGTAGQLDRIERLFMAPMTGGAIC